MRSKCFTENKKNLSSRSGILMDWDAVESTGQAEVPINIYRMEISHLSLGSMNFNRITSSVIVLLLLFTASCSLKKDGGMGLDGTWLLKIDSLNVGIEQEWFKAGLDRKDWRIVNVPDHWDRYNLDGYDGAGWYMRTFEIKEIAEPMALFFGGVDDDAEVWLNGTKVGSHVGYSESFYLDVTPALKVGANELVVRVVDHGGPGGIYKPITVIEARRVEELLKTKFSLMEARKSEEWVRDAVIYEVYLRSFSKEGTFKALEQRLPELKKLGVTVVWLMPIHPVGFLNRKGKLGSPYAVQDYYEVNPEFGTLDDFRSLVKAVHEHEMKIIIDLVANHTAWDSKLLLEHPDWFTTNADGAIVSPNADWHDVADLNYGHHELRKYMIEMMKYWVHDVGIDGYRCDVAELAPTDFWETARRELDKIKPVMMLSEGTLPEHHVGAFDVTYAWNFYDVLSNVIGGSSSASLFRELLKNESYQFPKGSLRMRFNTNHDKNAWDAPTVKKFTRDGAKASAVLAFTFPGVPLIYNGEEVGNEKSLDLFEKVEIDWTKNPDFRELYTALCKLRKDHPQLRHGEYEPLENSDGKKVVTFLRRSGKEWAIVIVNLSKDARKVAVTLPEQLTMKMQEYFTKKSVEAIEGQIAVDLKPFAFNVFVVQWR